MFDDQYSEIDSYKRTKRKKAGTKHVLCIKTVLFQPL